jgi:3-dehydroquinate dehydratase-2
MVDDIRKVLVIHGPNMNLLGQREPETYGTTSLETVDRQLEELGRQLDVDAETFQSNGEGAIIDRIQQAGRDGFSAIVINPAGYSSTSVAIRDALSACPLPVIEVHVSNIFKREAFRQNMLTAGACRGMICGLGVDSYYLALRAAVAMLGKEVGL